ncbi:hypothetical protein F5Y08DRAFT_294237 [Xylaria arbuscula]|nr:hypothetical protein F5Y08DRAFT_294237 [Xylaria arbuscula]
MHNSSCPKCGVSFAGDSKTCGSCGAVSPLSLSLIPSLPHSSLPREGQYCSRRLRRIYHVNSNTDGTVLSTPGCPSPMVNRCSWDRG